MVKVPSSVVAADTPPSWLVGVLRFASSEVSARRSLRGAALLLCSLCSLYGWWATAPAFTENPFQDWAVFHTAVTAYFRFGDWSAIFANWTLADHPWLYPPSFLCLIASAIQSLIADPIQRIIASDFTRLSRLPAHGG